MISSLFIPRHRIKTILVLALPIMTGMLSQSVLNIIDAAMVGSLGETALAGVGIGGYATFAACALAMGLGSGVQAMVSRRKGEGKTNVMGEPLNAGILMTLVIGIPIILIVFSFSDFFLQLLSADSAVVAVATPYFEMRVIGVFAVGFNFSFRGYWNGINRSTVYMSTIIAMHVVNVAVSYCLIWGHLGLPEMGATGAGLGTTISLYMGSIIYAILCFKYAKPHGFMRHWPSATLLRTISRVALPNSIQQFLFALSLTVLFTIIGSVGTPELAVAHVLITLILFVILPSIGLGLAAATLVGQAMGRGDMVDATRWGWDAVIIATILLASFGVPLCLFTDQVLGIFVHEPHLLELGRTPLRITGVFIIFDAVAVILTQALLGAGAAKKVMQVNLVMQWMFFLPTVWLVGPVLGYGLVGIWIVQALQRGITSYLFMHIWRQREWQTVKV
ncbi:MAG: MATE family efflux transporter [Pseudomonadales bacterium]|nr:MATE family efflux transporter [Pseudomonadales bacterium]